MKRLRRALDSAGLSQCASSLEEAEVLDMKTLDALTPEDWQELVGSEAERIRVQEVMRDVKEARKNAASTARLSATQTMKQPTWRPAGAATAKFEARKTCMSPTEDAVRIDTRRVLLRLVRETQRNPYATAEEKEWASTAAAVPDGQPTPRTLLTGSRWLLKVHDMVHVMPTPRKLHRCLGAITSRKYPQAPLMCDKVGEVIGLGNDGVSVKFFVEGSLHGEDVTMAMPAAGLTLRSTRFLTEEDVAKVASAKPPAAPDMVRTQKPFMRRRTGTFASTAPVPSAAKKSAASHTPPPPPPPPPATFAPEDIVSSDCDSGTEKLSAPVRSGVPGTERRGEPRGASLKAPLRRQKEAAPLPPREAKADTVLSSSVPSTDQGRWAQRRSGGSGRGGGSDTVAGDSVTSGATGEALASTHAELRELLRAFAALAHTFSGASALWASQLAGGHPASANLARELGLANDDLSKRASVLAAQLDSLPCQV